MRCQILLLYVVAVALISCKAKKNDGAANIIFVSNTTNMENTITIGERLKIKKETEYSSNDIVLFKITDPNTKNFTKVLGRVIGVSGDIVLIKSGRVFINHTLFMLPQSVKYHYKISFKSNEITADMKKDFDISHSDSKGFYDGFLTEEADSLMSIKYKNAIVFKEKSFIKEINQEALLSGKNKMGWTEDDFGPIRIFKKGEEVEGDSLQLLSIINGDPEVTQGHITHNYYFVISDNFHNGIDSRHLGLIRSDLIVGRLSNSSK